MERGARLSLLCYAYLHLQPRRIISQNTTTQQTATSDFSSLVVTQLKQQYKARDTALSGSKQALPSHLHAHEAAIAHSVFLPSVPLKK
jgi:hypothetical protein